jgi:hypothetical protein
MKMSRIIAFSLTAAACSHSPPERLVPVSQACIAAEDVPPAVPAAGRLPDDARQAADLLGAIVLQLRSNERVLRALIGPCTG